MSRPSEDIILQREFNGPECFRWTATYQSYDSADPLYGTGATPNDAVEQLLERSGDDR